MKIIAILFFVLFTSLFSNINNEKLYKEDISANKAYTMQQDGVILIDVRTKKEFEFSHPKGAINIPIFFDKFGQRVLNKDFIEQIDYALNGNMEKKVILICRSGSRTKFASNILAKEGFTEVYNVQAGFSYDWLPSKLPIEK